MTFPAGTVVMVCAFTGNRDGVDGDPEAFDITADRGDAKPLTFGAGIHYCLGANLARAELQEALAFLPARMPGLALDGEPELGSIHGIYGLERLPICDGPRARASSSTDYGDRSRPSSAAWSRSAASSRSSSPSTRTSR